MKKKLIFTLLILGVLFSSNTLKSEIIFQVIVSSIHHSGSGGYGSVSEVDRPLYGANGTIITVVTEIYCMDNGNLNCHGCAVLHLQNNGELVGIPASLFPYFDAMYQTAVTQSEGGQSSGNISNQYCIEGSGLFVINVSWNPTPMGDGFNYQITISRP